ncbi:MAG: ParB N-terminal domain-containing protein [Treponema sp.]|jgi:ParB family chromosome partitioning protein|nr:ParB N-terminal domain-containing protein [Treponema sp.]
MLVKISEIKVKKRVRKDLGDLDALKDSLRRYGLLNPITITKDKVLIAGERRLEAAKAIGWETIGAEVLTYDIDAIDKLEMEMEENNQRIPFTAEEMAEGYRRLDKLRNPSIFRRIGMFFVRIFKAIGRFFARIFSKKR